MTREELIECVTSRVLEYLSRNSEAGADGCRVLVMTGKGGVLSAAVKEILDRSCSYVVQDRKAAYAEELSAKDFDVLLLTELSNGQLASAALGVPYGAEARPLLEALSAGIPALVMEDGLCFKNDKNCSGPLSELYAGYFDRVVSYGLTSVSAATLESALKKASPLKAGAAAAESCGPVYQGKVLTERELLGILKQSAAKKVAISADTIVTPLAKDLIRAKNLEIVRN